MFNALYRNLLFRCCFLTFSKLHVQNFLTISSRECRWKRYDSIANTCRFSLDIAKNIPGRPYDLGANSERVQMFCFSFGGLQPTLTRRTASKLMRKSFLQTPPKSNCKYFPVRCRSVMPCKNVSNNIYPLLYQILKDKNK